MIIKVAKSAGFCWGVKRAVMLAVEATNVCKPVYCLGELIHNKLEIDRLKSFGIEFVDSVSGIDPGKTVVIRSHGVPPVVMQEVKKLGVRVVDATCPFVKEVHEKAVELEREGFPVCILGNPRHPEVVGIAGHVREPIILSSIEEVISLEPMQKLGVVCQTTIEQAFLKEATSILAEKVKELKIFNTVCSATRVRQEEARKLAFEVDVMLVIGGMNSSNTTKLYKLSKAVNPLTYHIESRSDVSLEWFSGVRTVGITAGASTPQWVIDEVVDYLKAVGEGKPVEGEFCQTA